MASRFERAEIEERQRNRLLDLVGVGSGQEDPRDVGFVELDPGNRLRVAAGLQERTCERVGRKGLHQTILNGYAVDSLICIKSARPARRMIGDHDDAQQTKE
jgi:hypothetical protein